MQTRRCSHAGADTQVKTRRCRHAGANTLAQGDQQAADTLMLVHALELAGTSPKDLTWLKTRAYYRGLERVRAARDAERAQAKAWRMQVGSCSKRTRIQGTCPLSIPKAAHCLWQRSLRLSCLESREKNDGAGQLSNGKRDRINTTLGLDQKLDMPLCTDVSIRLVELYGTVRLRSVRYAPYLLNYGILP